MLNEKLPVFCYNFCKRRDYMEESDVIKLLRYYRHSVLNQLQLIQGYVSMDKPEMVKEKINTYNAYLHEEQKLMDMRAPSFTIWLLFFNDIHATIRLTYEIEMENMNLGDADIYLTTQCKILFDYLNDHLSTTDYYEGHLKLQMDQSGSLLKASIDLNGDFSRISSQKMEHLQEISRFQ